MNKEELEIEEIECQGCKELFLQGELEEGLCYPCWNKINGN